MRENLQEIIEESDDESDDEDDSNKKKKETFVMKDMNDNTVAKLFEKDPFKGKKVTDKLLEDIEKYLAKRTQEIEKTMRIMKKTLPEVHQKCKEYNKAAIECFELENDLQKLMIAHNDAKNSGKSTRSYLNEGMDMDNILVIWVGDVGGIAKQYKQLMKKALNKDVEDLTDTDGAVASKRKFKQDITGIVRWNQFILKKLFEESNLNDVAIDCKYLSDLQKHTGLKFVSDGSNSQNRKNQMFSKAIAFLCDEWESSLQAPDVLSFVKKLLKDFDMENKDNDLGFHDVQEMKDTLKKFGDKEWKRICGIDTVELKNNKAKNKENKHKEKETVQSLGHRGGNTAAGSTTSGYTKYLGANYKEPKIVYLCNPEFLAIAKEPQKSKFFKNAALNMRDESRYYIRAHNLMVLEKNRCDVHTLVHEFGHAFGLDEEFLAPSADDMWEIADLVSAYGTEWEMKADKTYRASTDYFDMGSVMVYEESVVRLSEKANLALRDKKIKVKIPKTNGEAETKEFDLPNILAESFLPSVWDAAFLRHVYFKKPLTHDEIKRIPKKASEGAVLSKYDKERGGYRNGEELRKNINLIFKEFSEPIKAEEKIITEYLSAVKTSVLDDLTFFKQNDKKLSTLLDDLEKLVARMKSDSEFANEKDRKEAEKIAGSTRPLVKNIAGFMLRVSILALNSQLILESRKDMPAFTNFIPTHEVIPQ